MLCTAAPAGTAVVFRIPKINEASRRANARAANQRSRSNDGAPIATTSAPRLTSAQRRAIKRATKHASRSSISANSAGESNDTTLQSAAVPPAEVVDLTHLPDTSGPTGAALHGPQAATAPPRPHFEDMGYDGRGNGPSTFGCRSDPRTLIPPSRPGETIDDVRTAWGTDRDRYRTMARSERNAHRLEMERTNEAVTAAAELTEALRAQNTLLLQRN